MPNQVGPPNGRLTRIASIALLVLVAGCLGTGLPSTVTPTQPSPTPLADQPVVTVTEVVDGDTLEIEFQSGATDTVRLLGIDTPEVHTETDPPEFEGVPETEAGRTCLREEGQEASEHLTTMLEGKQVRLAFDPQADRRGSYDRLLAYVYLNGTNVNYDLVAEGIARVYDSRFSQSDRFYEAENMAQSEGRGVWRCATAATTERPVDRDLIVTTVHADAAGDDTKNLNDEYVTFENTGEHPIDLGGWSVRDQAGHAYRFPDGFSLGAGETVTLHTGSGTDTATDRYWGADGAVWNNGGDTVRVIDANGSVVLERSY